MRTKRILQIGAAAAAAVVVAVLIARAIRARAPYHVDEALLSNWSVAAAPPGDAAVVEVKPPSRLLEDLFEQVIDRTGEPLVAAERAAVPLVLSEEYADSLQGALSIDDIVSAGLGLGLDTVRFAPVCMAERHRRNGDREEELIFAVFDAPAFDEFRQELTPLFPEHAGSGVYHPPAVRLILPVAATSGDVDRWWPIAFDPRQDCGTALRAS